MANKTTLETTVLRWVEGPNGETLDARVDVTGSTVILHSRGGTAGSSSARNTQYETALHEICRRGKASNAFARILIDSARVRHLPEDQRVLVEEAELAALPLDELISKIRSRLRTFGQLDGVTGGNSTKRVRFDLKFGTTSQLLRLRVNPPDSPADRHLTPEEIQGIEEILRDVPDDEARSFAEGSRSRAMHLKRERNRSLVAAFKIEFLNRHGQFHCEACGRDWIEEYGPEIASACFEAHHATLQVSEMDDGHESVIEDLELLCSNCHRAEHRRMKIGEN